MSIYRYAGPERRKRQRRAIKERRMMIRFEPGKEPRRILSERRTQHIWDLHTISFK